MGVLGNHLLNCAGFHATDRGFGIATLNEDNYVGSFVWPLNSTKCLINTKSSAYKPGLRMYRLLQTVTLPSLTKTARRLAMPVLSGL